MSRVYVGNLGSWISEGELENEFRGFGIIRRIWVAKRPPGYAFIDFVHSKDAENAVYELDGKNGWRVEFSHKSIHAVGQYCNNGNISITNQTPACGKIGMTLKVSRFVGSDTWIIDSGASDHMTYDNSHYITDLSPPPVSYVTNANGEAFPVLGIGSVRVTPVLTLHNVLYVPDLSHHLISVPQLNTESRCSVTFYPMYVIFQDLLTREIIGRGDLRGRLFHLDQTYAGEKPGAPSRTALTASSNQLGEIWL